MMGINFIVVKGNESSFRDSRTLEELIRNSDVVSIDNSVWSNNEALEDEKNHREFIFMDHGDRRASLKATRKADNYYLKDVVMKVLEKRKPLVYLERYADEEEVKRMVARGKSINEGYASIDLFRGDYCNVLHKLFTNLLRDIKYYAARDSNMVSNARSIQQKIFLLYPHLKEKRQLNYLVVVYRLHRIEEGLLKIPDSSVQTIDLMLPDVPLWWGHEPFMKIAGENASFEQCKDMLARALLSYVYKHTICNAPEHYLMPLLCNAAVSKMGVEDLKILNSRINPNASKTEKIEAFRQFFAGNGIDMPRQLRDYRRLLEKYSV